MCRTARLRVHDALLKIAFDFSGERFGHVTDRKKAVAVDKDSSGSVHGRLLRDLQLDLQVFVLVFELFHDRLKSGELVLVSGPRRAGTKFRLR